MVTEQRTGGMKMTIDEAIRHCEEVAEEQSRLYSLCPCPCDGTDNCMSLKNGKDMGCTKCAADHRQLAEWLTNYKEAIRLLKAAVEDMHIEDMCDVCVKRIPNSPIRCSDDSNCFVWRYKDETLKLIQNS